MLNDPRVQAFETATIDPSVFRHRDHLYVAWCYLQALPLEEALARFVRHLRSLAQALGAPGKFHATITWTYLILLHEAMQEPELSGADFDTLLSKHPSLLDQKEGALFEHYDRAEIDSEVARQRFVFPRRHGATEASR
jgi:hypothetical protein